MHSIEIPPLTRASNVLTWLGSAIMLPIVAIVSAALLRSRGLRYCAWFPIAAIAMAELLTETAKLIVRRPRPQPWFAMHTDPWSFPSGHSLDSMTCYAVCGAALLSLIPSRAYRAAFAAFCATLPIAIGLSRIYLGVHWPTDVLAGWLAGACLAAGFIRSLRIVRRRLRYHIAGY
jgi:undecaprenyl-diphosphatase